MIPFAELHDRCITCPLFDQYQDGRNEGGLIDNRPYPDNCGKFLCSTKNCPHGTEIMVDFMKKNPDVAESSGWAKRYSDDPDCFKK